MSSLEQLIRKTREYAKRSHRTFVLFIERYEGAPFIRCITLDHYNRCPDIDEHDVRAIAYPSGEVDRYE